MWKQKLLAAVAAARAAWHKDPNAPPRLETHDVVRAYRVLFDREPESPEVIEEHASSYAEPTSLWEVLLGSAEFRRRVEDLVEPRTVLDWRALRARFNQPDALTLPGHVTDFLGIHTRSDYLGNEKQLEGRIDGLPVAGDARCSAAEWIAGLRGVELAAGDRFVMVELGAGWGAWMATLSRAARLRGIPHTLAIGCEADALHCKMLHEHLTLNGFTPDDFRLFQGAVGTHSGVALFPKSSNSAEDWGMRPIFCASQEEAAKIETDPSSHLDYRGYQFAGFDQVRCYSLAEIMAEVDHVDVLHIDVQGSEVELIEHNLELLGRLVGYLIVGTHSREIEGRLLALLTHAGWTLEVEDACRFDLRNRNFPPMVDGVQGWRSPVASADALAPASL